MSDVNRAHIDSYFTERAKSKRGGRLNAYTTLTPAKTALVVVDMQDYFLVEGMPSCIKGGTEIIPDINRLAEAVRATGGRVIWIQTEAPADKSDWANRAEATSPKSWASRQQLLAKDGAGFPIHKDCDVRPEDLIAIKYRYSGFLPYTSELESLLKKHGLDTVLITGVATSTCCESTARDASMLGYRTIMISDGNWDDTQQIHSHTLGKFLTTFGDVQTTEEVIGRLTGEAKTAAAE
ncbi:MAG: hypothetical protein RLZ98_1984 [Pseudomonadota bacterium]|jgi:ureidoacrylate peracid hydrolase